MDWLYLLNSFDGRISRKPFWIAMAAVTAANAIACYVAIVIDGDRLSAIVDLLFTYPQFAIATKRCHDRNMAIWLLIVFFGANAVLDLFDVLGLSGTPDNPSMQVIVISVPFMVLLVVLLIELGFRRGTPGPNRYGPDPFGPRAPSGQS
jgi:uncharacterized membrane protein YhaH (DUF805 family)